MNQKMLSLGEKIQTAPPLIPMLIEGQDFIDRQVSKRGVEVYDGKDDEHR